MFFEKYLLRKQTVSFKGISVSKIGETGLDRYVQVLTGVDIQGQVEYQLETNWLKGAKFANFRQNFRSISKFEG